MSFQEPLENQSTNSRSSDSEESDRESMGTRRKLYVEEPEPCIKVFLRIRDYTDEEAKRQLPTIDYKTENDETLIITPPAVSASRGAASHKFTFSRIYEPDVGQQELFDSSLQNAVREFVGGGNFLAFNYGVTNAGKTFTMQGTPQQPGLVPRALDAIFLLLQGKISPKLTVKPHCGGVIKLGSSDKISDLRFKEDLLNKDCDSTTASIFMDTLNGSAMHREQSSNFSTASSNASDLFSNKTSRFNFTQDSLNADASVTHSIWVSFVEVYNEVIFDLLEIMKSGKRMQLKLCEQGNGNVFIKGVKEVCVFTAEEAYRVLLAGQKNLCYAATKLNHNSSRSHCLFTVKLVTLNQNDRMKITQFSFCDLAGSECAAKTQSQGKRLREAGLINTSLLVLGRCFEILRANRKLGKANCLPVPFRESKLTRILQNNLNGKAHALMIVNMSPCSNVYNETLHALKFAALASEVVLSRPQSQFTHDLKPTKCTLAQLHRSLGDRESISLESSGANKDSEVNESQEWESDPNEEIDYKQKTEELLELAKKLSARLNKERADKLQMEIDVREELTEEFQARIGQLQDFYQDQLDQAYEVGEDLAARRLEIQEEFYKSAKRLKRSNDIMQGVAMENDSKIAEMKSEIRILARENEALKLQVRNLEQASVIKQEQFISLQFQMAQIQHEAIHRTEELEIAKAQLVAKEKVIIDMENAMPSQITTFWDEEKNRSKLIDSFMQNFESMHSTLLLKNGTAKTDVQAAPLPESEEDVGQMLNRLTMYFSMSSSTALSSSVTPKSGHTGSLSMVESVPSGDKVVTAFAVPCAIEEKPRALVLSPQTVDEVFVVEDQTDLVATGSAVQSAAAALPRSVGSVPSTGDELFQTFASDGPGDVAQAQNSTGFTTPVSKTSLSQLFKHKLEI